MIRPDNKQTVLVGDKLPYQVGLLVEFVELVELVELVTWLNGYMVT